MSDLKHKFDFDTPVDRRHTNSVKWDFAAEDEIPMWVADMDFKAAPAILDALEEKLRHGVFGYTSSDERWYEAYISWWKRRHGLTMQKDWLVFCAGVVPAISSMVRVLTQPDDNVVIQSPVYNMFYNSIRENGRNLVESELVYDRETGTYSIDFEDLEKKLSDPKTVLMILCNPHNPIGRIWSREELLKIGELCLKHHVMIISDEIHCDIVKPGCGYVPFASVSEELCMNSITCMAPTKAFNIAGLKTAAVMIADPDLRSRISTAFRREGVAETETFALPAAIAAFDESEDWLDQLNEYLFENRRVFEDYVSEHMPGVRAVPGEATYLVWLDISEPMKNMPEGTSEDVSKILRKQAKVFVSSGHAYGTAGDHFLRVNIACPRSVMMEGLARLEAGLKAL